MSPRGWIAYLGMGFFVLMAGIGASQTLFGGSEGDAAAGSLMFFMFFPLALFVWVILFYWRRHLAKNMGVPDGSGEWSFGLADKIILGLWPSVFIFGFIAGVISV